MNQPSYASSVFINCPFDSDYEPILHSIIFTVFACGFVPRSALEEDDSTDLRLEKIARLIAGCKYGIHDISKTALDKETRLPRFNMPFELGLFWGAKRFGTEQNREKVALIFEEVRFSHQKFLSDINGVDIKAHNGNPAFCIRAIRDWLSTNSKRKTIPSATVIINYFGQFREEKLPAILAENKTSISELTFNDFCYYVTTVIEASNKSK